MNETLKVVIVDYGLGNIFSIERVLAHLGVKPKVSSDAAEITRADRLILPGVGAFADGMKNLRERGLDLVLKNYAALNRPFLGICLGMQLLFDESEEFGVNQGLGIVKGRVIRLLPAGKGEPSYKIPHVGWNSLLEPCLGKWQGSIFQGGQPGECVYFVHSFHGAPADPNAILAETIYGNNRFCSAIKLGSISACQFHPEISGEVGLRMLHNFLFKE